MASSGLSFTGSLPEAYERFLVAPLFRPLAGEMLDRAELTDTDRLLDVACGTGIVARIARERAGDAGRIVGVDASPDMLAMARTVAPAIEWRQGTVTHLPVRDDETFDLVACHQGLQFFPDKPAAIREMRRVLAPRGRIAVAAFLPVEEVPLMRDLQRVAERHLGPYVDQRHCFGDPEAIGQLLADAGFTAVQSGKMVVTVRISDGASFPRLNAGAIAGMHPAAKGMSDDQRKQVIATIAAESVATIQPYLHGSELVFDMGSALAIARL